MTEKIINEKEISHPMEDVFDIEPCTTVVEYEESLPAELVEHEEYDEKDKELEDQFETIYTRAMDAFDVQSDEAEAVEGKYKARNAEVAATYLNAALSAVKEKADMKKHKDKINIDKQKAGTPGTVNQNLIVDRNDLMRALLREDKE